MANKSSKRYFEAQKLEQLTNNIIAATAERLSENVSKHDNRINSGRASRRRMNGMVKPRRGGAITTYQM